MYKNRFDVLSAWTCYVRPAIYFFQRPNRGQNSHYMKLINETNVQSAYLFKETAADITGLAGCCFSGRRNESSMRKKAILNRNKTNTNLRKDLCLVLKSGSKTVNIWANDLSFPVCKNWPFYILHLKVPPLYILTHTRRTSTRSVWREAYSVTNPL